MAGYIFVTIAQCFLYFFCNVFTKIVNVFIRRDDRIIIFGAWSGKRFGGNPRNLYQYLFENKEKKGLERVVWIARDRSLIKELESMKYEVYYIYSIKSLFLHFKAGRFVTNGGVTGGFASGSYAKSSFLGLFSIGAKHYYVNHDMGAGKSNMVFDRKKLKGIKRILVESHLLLRKSRFIRHYVLNAGGWDECECFLHSGKVQRERDAIFFQNYPINSVITCFPEFMPVPQLLPSEQKFIKSIPRNKLRVLYLPVYRTAYTDYRNPLDDKDFLKFLKMNNICWMEKLFPTGKDIMSPANEEVYNYEEVLKVPVDMDTNVVLENADILVVDYTSSRLKAIVRHKPLLYFCPDYKQYCDKDKGVTPLIKEAIERRGCFNTYSLMEQLKEAMDSELFFSAEKETEYKNELSDQIEVLPVESSYEKICFDIFGF